MTYLKYLPKTNFLLPNGSSVDSRNILKSVILSSNFINDSTQSRKKTIDHIKRIENISYKEYRQNMSFYWLILMMNGIDSFSKVAMSQSMFEQNYLKKYNGKVYYVKNAASNTVSGILPGDMVTLFDTDGTWKYAGIVKEYDSIFRRIIVEKEYENEDSTNDLTSPITASYRRLEGDSWITKGFFQIGRRENEADKIIKIYKKEPQYTEVSPYAEIDGDNELTGNYNFGITPSDTILFALANSNSTLTGYKYYTKLEEQLELNASYKNLKFTSANTAFKLNSALSELKSTNFSRGKILKVKS